MPLARSQDSVPPDPASTEATFGNQDALIAAVAAANPRTLAVLETGAPVLTPWRESLAALLEAWYPGEDGGTAIAHVPLGDVSPGWRRCRAWSSRRTSSPASTRSTSRPDIRGGSRCRWMRGRSRTGMRPRAGGA
jgi:beta-glucosidase